MKLRKEGPLRVRMWESDKLAGSWRFRKDSGDR